MPRKSKSNRSSAGPRDSDSAGRDPDVRIIGGQFRGRRLRYHGDPVVRPMKHRTREAIFNLVTTDAVDRHVMDLFAGTGALGLEALSRGAVSATFIEKHVPSAKVVEENIRTLDVADRATLLVTSAFLWMKRDLPNAAVQGGPSWLVFCSPPYAFYSERRDEMLELISGFSNMRRWAACWLLKRTSGLILRRWVAKMPAAWSAIGMCGTIRRQWWAFGAKSRKLRSFK
jgi:16S rRNA (guanine966-N2)-methyltransferase